MRPHTYSRRLILPLAILSSVFVAACGDDEGATSAAKGNGVDRAFVADMVPHHQSAVEMAEIAQKRARHTEIKQLADAIVKTQNEEIQTMDDLAAEFDKAGVEKGDLGLVEHEMGMDGDSNMLVDAKPFDREFIDMMIPHHQGAIRMARAELKEGKNADTRRLAQAIIDAQTKEIDEMNMWRVDWYGTLSPAGGVPAKTHH